MPVANIDWSPSAITPVAAPTGGTFEVFVAGELPVEIHHLIEKPYEVLENYPLWQHIYIGSTADSIKTMAAIHGFPIAVYRVSAGIFAGGYDTNANLLNSIGATLGGQAVIGSPLVAKIPYQGASTDFLVQNFVDSLVAASDADGTPAVDVVVENGGLQETAALIADSPVITKVTHVPNVAGRTGLDLSTLSIGDVVIQDDTNNHFVYDGTNLVPAASNSANGTEAIHVPNAAGRTGYDLSTLTVGDVLIQDNTTAGYVYDGTALVPLSTNPAAAGQDAIHVPNGIARIGYDLSTLTIGDVVVQDDTNNGYVYDGTNLVPFAADAAGAKSAIHVPNTSGRTGYDLSTLTVGDVLIQDDTNNGYVYDGTALVPLSSNAASGGQSAVHVPNVSAKNAYPLGSLTIGDVVVQDDNGDHFVYDGTSLVPAANNPAGAGGGGGGGGTVIWPFHTAIS
jgi:hypothetical protein